MTPAQSEHQKKLLNRLAVIVDLSRPDYVRESAIREVQQMLPSTNPLRLVQPSDLLERVLQPWETRVYMEQGRGVKRVVTRPPASLRDVFR